MILAHGLRDSVDRADGRKRRVDNRNLSTCRETVRIKRRLSGDAVNHADQQVGRNVHIYVGANFPRQNGVSNKLPALTYFSIVNYVRHDIEPRSVNTWLLLMLGGPITTLPLVLFAAAAKHVPMAAMGMLQYIAPSLQFLFGVFLFGEEVSRGRAYGFALVWLALILFSGFVIASSRSTNARKIE